MPKVRGHGQASILSFPDYLKIRKQLHGWHKIFWDIAYYTGERWGAICQLMVGDIYSDPVNSIPSEYVTFRASTRKADTKGKRRTRQVPIHPNLDEALRAYKPPLQGWMFPSDRRVGQPVTFHGADQFLRRTLIELGMEDAGISTHSTRRSLITRLDENGVSIKVIQAITGHQDLEVLGRYIEVSPHRIRRAIENS